MADGCSVVYFRYCFHSLSLVKANHLVLQWCQHNCGRNNLRVIFAKIYMLQHRAYNCSREWQRNYARHKHNGLSLLRKINKIKWKRKFSIYFIPCCSLCFCVYKYVWQLLIQVIKLVLHILSMFIDWFNIMWVYDKVVLFTARSQM